MYFVVRACKVVLYVGKSGDAARRCLAHRLRFKGELSFFLLPVDDGELCLRFEKAFIALFDPPHNLRKADALRGTQIYEAAHQLAQGKTGRLIGGFIYRKPKRRAA